MIASVELIEAAERATLAALCPCAQEELDDWLLPYEPSVVGRAKSAVPLRHANLSLHSLPEIIARYRARGLPPRFRLADVPGLSNVHKALAELGFSPGSPTHVQLSTPAALHGLVSDSMAHVLEQQPDATWQAAFVAAGAAGKDAREEAERLAILQRSPFSLFAEVREAGRVLSVGTAHVGHGLLSLHGIRTVAAARGRGLARHTLAALGGTGQARGAQRVLLQVEADNQAALALYAHAGFTHAWTYRYWVER